LEDVGEVDLVFDVLGGDIAKRSAGLIRAGGTHSAHLLDSTFLLQALILDLLRPGGITEYIPGETHGFILAGLELIAGELHPLERVTGTGRSAKGRSAKAEN
jgi:hypothetical protein